VIKYWGMTPWAPPPLLKVTETKIICCRNMSIWPFNKKYIFLVWFEIWNTLWCHMTDTHCTHIIIFGIVLVQQKLPGINKCIKLKLQDENLIHHTEGNTVLWRRSHSWVEFEVFRKSKIDRKIQNFLFFTFRKIQNLE